METVRLTIQLRDPGNSLRVTMHRDIPLAKVAEKASEYAQRMARNFKKEKRQQVTEEGE